LAQAVLVKLVLPQEHLVLIRCLVQLVPQVAGVAVVMTILLA
jgi:hypothetical protein